MKMIGRRGKEYVAPWERAFDRVLTPVEDFMRQETAGGLLLMVSAALALLVANSPLAESYRHILHAEVVVGSGDWILRMSLHHWINDGLMAIFFLVVGLELKRELLVGELANLRQAVLPIMAALGGMVAPALIYVAINAGGPGISGWGVPMATDIAFAMGVLGLLGKRVPPALPTLLVALAIVDDLGAILVIALFYTASIDLLALAAAGVITLLLVALNMGGIRRLLPYMLLGVLLWLALLKSGVHATLAGVILAFTVPMKPKLDPQRFLDRARGLLDEISHSQDQGSCIVVNDQMRGRVTALGEGVRLAQAPAQVLEHALHRPSAFLVIPIFALANAGVPLDAATISNLVTHPVAVGVVAGLLGGKLLGVVGFVWLTVKLGWGRLPSGVDFRHILGLALLAAIGFTMSIFIAELAFVESAEKLLMAKTGILVVSVLAGGSGYLWLRFMTRRPG